MKIVKKVINIVGKNGRIWSKVGENYIFFGPFKKGKL